MAVKWVWPPIRREWVFNIRISTVRRFSPARNTRYGHKVSGLNPVGKINCRERGNIPRECILLRRRRGQNGERAGAL